MSTVKNAVAIITGATGGIGEALCIALAARGARLVMVARSSEALAALQNKLVDFAVPIIAHPCDISRPEEVRMMCENAMATFGAVDILVNNAAIGLFQTVCESERQDISKLLSTNLLGAIYCIQETLPVMRKQKRGHVVNISSVIAKHASYHQGIYAASKAGLDRISEALAAEEEQHGIRVTLALPDRTETEFLDHALGPRELAVLPGGNMRKLSTKQVAHGIVNAIERNESVHYSSWRGRLFALMSGTVPSVVRHLLGYPK